MTGLKSGSGDDLWDDEEEEPEDPPETVRETDEAKQSAGSQEENTSEQEHAESADSGGKPEEQERQPDPGTTPHHSEQQPYIVRRAVQDKSVQFERDERLTFFVHDDVVDGERDLLADAERALGRDVPKFDVREAVYRAALNNKEDVIAELVKMGYSTSK